MLVGERENRWLGGLWSASWLGICFGVWWWCWCEDGIGKGIGCLLDRSRSTFLLDILRIFRNERHFDKLNICDYLKR
jgi:lipoprotein signal peptidase